jgi:hypothetical protein
MVAPYALSNDASDHALFAVCPGDSSQAALDVKFALTDSTTYPSSFRVLSDGPSYALSVHGTLTGALDWATTGAVGITVTAANSAALSRLISSVSVGTLALIGTGFSFVGDQEFVVVSSARVTSTTSATFTITARGLADTYPHQWPAGTSITLLTGIVLDSAGLATECRNLSGTVLSSTTGSDFSRTWATYKNGPTFGTAHQTDVLSSNLYYGVPGTGARAMRPVWPGAVMLDGFFGGYNPHATGLPTVSRAGKTNIRLSWINRGKGSLTSWFSPTPGDTAGLTITYYVWSKINEAADPSTFTLLTSASVPATTTYVDIPSWRFSTGNVVKVTVGVSASTGSTESYGAGGASFGYTASDLNPGVTFGWTMVA